MSRASSCEACAVLTTQDALKLTTHEVVEVFHNPCAPVTQYTCRCKTCQARWVAVEVFDEEGHRPSEWSWELCTDK